MFHADKVVEYGTQIVGGAHQERAVTVELKVNDSRFGTA